MTNGWTPIRLGDIELEHCWPTALILNHPDANLETRLADIEKGRADMVVKPRYSM